MSWVERGGMMGCLGLVLLASGCASATSRPQRYGMVIGVREEKLAEYKKLHAAVWPAVLGKIRDCNIRNYSIYLAKLDDGKYYLFSYFDYVGKDFKADMDKMAADPTTQEWWALCKPCHRPIAARAEGEWWANMEEVFHCD